jgi:amino acid transporter
MRRIFTILLILIAAALVAAVTTGLLSWSADGLHNPDSGAYLTHFVVGLFTAVGVLASHCLVITYFLGTGRWVKEVCIAYGLPDERWPRQTRDIKRGNTPYAIVAMLVTIGAAAAGAGRQVEVWPASIHATLATATVLVNAWVWSIEYRNMKTNIRILDEVYAEAERMRAEQGLPPSAEALTQKDQG